MATASIIADRRMPPPPTYAARFSADVDAEIVARATALIPLIAQHAARTEQDRQVVPEVIEALEGAGLFDVIVPRRFGGLGAAMATQLAVAAEIGSACLSSAWVQSLTNITTWGASRSPCASALFSGAERVRACGVIAPSGTARRVEGGFRVTGQWPFSSGSHHANLFSGGVMVEDETGAPLGPGMVYVPRGEWTIKDTWHVAGVRGSGSNTVVLDDVFVPADRLVMLINAAGTGSEATDRWPMGPALTAVLLGPMLGAARASAEIVTKNVAVKPISYTTYARGADSTASVVDVAEARLDIDTGWLHAFQVAAYIDGVGRGETQTFAENARARGQCGYVTTVLRRGVDTLLSVNGASSFANVAALQRHWRDLNVASRHAFLVTNVSLEIYGRSLFDLQPIVMIV